jgi:hypothetical protein
MASKGVTIMATAAQAGAPADTSARSLKILLVLP